MLHEDLKTRTGSSHQALEKQLIARIKTIQSPVQYATLLKILYGFYAAMEEAIASMLSANNHLDFKDRRKASLIISDLEYLQDAGTPALCEKIPTINSPAHALGALYVLEGSTLGGKFIARMIAAQLNLENNNSLSFFMSYGDRTEAMWQAFKKNLDLPFTIEEKEEIIQTATNTFITFKHWIDKHEANQL